jgi:hypothetical protein
LRTFPAAAAAADLRNSSWEKSRTFQSRATSEQSYQTRPTKNAEINVEKASFEQQQISREFPGKHVQKSGTFHHAGRQEQSYQTSNWEKHQKSAENAASSDV